MQTGNNFPDHPKEQLIQVIKTIFELQNISKAIIYKQDNDIPNIWGIAVHVQSIRFGNKMDIFGIENDQLYMIDSKFNKKIAQATQKIACDIGDEEVYEQSHTIQKNQSKTIDRSKHKIFDMQDIKNYNYSYKYVNFTEEPLISEKELIKVDEQIKKLVKKK